MKRALRVFICKSMHMQSKRADTRSFSALFCGVNQVLQDSEASHAILADDFTRGKVISDADETLNVFDLRANAASSIDGNERNGSDDVHLMIAEERRARCKLQAQFQTQLSEMGGKIDDLIAAVGKVNEVLGKAILCAPETPGVAASRHSQSAESSFKEFMKRQHEVDAAWKKRSVVEHSGRPAISRHDTDQVSAQLGYTTPHLMSVSQLGRDQHSFDHASRSVPPVDHDLTQAEMVYILPKIDDMLVSSRRIQNYAVQPPRFMQLPRPVCGLPVPFVAYAHAQVAYTSTQIYTHSRALQCCASARASLRSRMHSTL
jgi:hypothetical protein